MGIFVRVITYIIARKKMLDCEQRKVYYGEQYQLKFVTISAINDKLIDNIG